MNPRKESAPAETGADRNRRKPSLGGKTSNAKRSPLSAFADTSADEDLFAVTTATRCGAELAVERVDSSDAYWPPLRRLLPIALDLPRYSRVRPACVATMLDLSISDVQRRVDERVSMWDTDGRVARRVLDQARLRRAFLALEEASRRLVAEGCSDSVRAALSEALEAVS